MPLQNKGLLNSDIAIEMNIAIMRAFIAMRKILSKTPDNNVYELQVELNQIRVYFEEVFSDYNDISEDTRMQIELINQSLAELQFDKTNRRDSLPRMLIVA
jgi:hypothetical protein